MPKIIEKPPNTWTIRKRGYSSPYILVNYKNETIASWDRKPSTPKIITTLKTQKHKPGFSAQLCKFIKDEQVWVPRIGAQEWLAIYQPIKTYEYIESPEERTQRIKREKTKRTKKEHISSREKASQEYLDRWANLGR